MKQRQYNLDKTAYDLEKENKRFIWKFFTYLYFLLFSLRNFKEIYIMCGIIGFTGNLQAPGILVDGLQQLEYRGYDSAGIAVNNGSETKIVKTTGKVATLREKVEAVADLAGTCGIGHTRWATHGGVTEVNAHPHVSGNVTLIHNGIIENYKELAASLKTKGFTAISETDTEVAAMLIDSLYDGDPFAALKEADQMLEGAYGFCVMFKDHPGEIYCMRNASPLVASHTEDGSFIASDMVALLKYTKDYFVVPEEHIVVMKADSITLYTMDGGVEEPKMLHVDWDTTAAQKGGYDFFMQKEIYDQPAALHNTIMPRIHNGHADFSADNISDDIFKGVNRVIVTACGTAWHAGLVGRHLIEAMIRIPVTVELASEFRYMNPILDEHTLVVVITQSGETADSLAALRLANERGAKTISIVNVKGSSIARESDYVLYTHAGPEIAVASTKAFSVQCAGMYLIALKLAEVNNLMTNEQMKDFCDKFEQAIGTVEEVLKMDDYIKGISEKIQDTFSAFYLGRGLDYGIACEACLKLKEISYVNAEAYCAGELKHGTISLITEGVPVIAIATQENVLPKLMANVEEVKARGAHVIVVTDKDMSNYEGIYDDLIQVPATDDLFATFASTVALQLLAYHVTVFRGYDVDQPRNLAKSVTVE